MTGFHLGAHSVYLGDVDEELEKEFLPPFHQIIEQQVETAGGYINIYINSHGGLANIAFHIISMIEFAKKNDVVVRTIVTDSACSAGSLIAVAGTPGERYIAKDARHVVHYGSSGSLDMSPLQAERNFNYRKKFFKRVVNTYNKYCNIPDLEESIREDDWFIEGRNAIKWGMADKDLSKLNLGEPI